MQTVKPRAKRMRTVPLWYVHHKSFGMADVYDASLDNAIVRFNANVLVQQTKLKVPRETAN